jgi:hypothetical protein
MYTVQYTFFNFRCTSTASNYPQLEKYNFLGFLHELLTRNLKESSIFPRNIGTHLKTARYHIPEAHSTKPIAVKMIHKAVILFVS